MDNLVERAKMRELAILGLATPTPRRKSDAALFGELADALASQATLIAELQGEVERLNAEREKADGMDGAVVHAIREVLYAGEVPLSAFIDDHVANAIVQRNQERTRAEAAETTLAFVYRWTWEKDGNGTSDAEKFSAIKHYPPISALKGGLNGK